MPETCRFGAIVGENEPPETGRGQTNTSPANYLLWSSTSRHVEVKGYAIAIEYADAGVGRRQ